MNSNLLKVKKNKLTYSDYITFLTKSAVLCMSENGLIMHSIKNMIFKVMFARYYLDVELPESDIDAYDIVCDINYLDYKDSIAWNQFVDLQSSFDIYCEEIDKNANKDINEAVIELIISITELLNSMKESIDEVDVKNTLELMTDFKNSLGTVGTEETMRFFLDKTKKESSNENNNSLEDEVLN